MTLRPALLILKLSSVAWAFPCHFSAPNWIGDPFLNQTFKERKEIPSPAFEPLLKTFAALIEKPETPKTKAWLEEIDQLPVPEQKAFVNCLRRWLVVNLTDPKQRKALSTIEGLTKEKAPLLSLSFCLDDEFGVSEKELTRIEKILLDLAGDRKNFESFSGEIEKQHHDRIQEKPLSGQRVLEYVKFLFATDRLIEAKARLKEAVSLDPKLDVKELSDGIEKAKKISDPLKRATFIRSLQDEWRKKK